MTHIRKDSSTLTVNPNPHFEAGSIMDVVRSRYVAWWTERITHQELRILDSRRTLIESRAAVHKSEFVARDQLAFAATQAELRVVEGKAIIKEAHLIGHRRLATAAVQAHEAEADLRLRARLQEATYSEAGRILGSELMVEQLLVERETLRRQRLRGSQATLPAWEDPPHPLLLGAAESNRKPCHALDAEIEQETRDADPFDI